MNHPHRRRVHLCGDTMTACGKIISASMRGGNWSGVMPWWRCPACVRAVEARRAAITEADVEAHLRALAEETKQPRIDL